MNTTTISDLPPEMILELFKRLDAISLVACSSVNKLWHSIFSGIKLDRLVVIGDPEKCPLKWRYSPKEKKIEDHELCSPKLFPRLAEQPMLSNLKYLALLDHTLRFDLNLLNKFTQLVYLQIIVDSTCMHPLDEEFYLGELRRRDLHLQNLLRNIENRINRNVPHQLANIAQLGNIAIGNVERLQEHDFNQVPLTVNIKLPKLKVFAYTELNYRSYVLSIDCPELNVFAYEKPGAGLHVSHPETIRTLYTSMSLSKIFKFKNLECLVIDQLEFMCIDTLQSLPKLQELRYDLKFESAYLARHRSVDYLKRTWRRFLEVANRLRPDFRLVFAGLHLTETNLMQIEVREHRKHGVVAVPDEYLYMMNYEMIDPEPNLVHVEQLDYHLLSDLIKEIPACFSQKFAYVQRVDVIGAVHDPVLLQSFLKALRGSLRKLRIDLPNLSQEFYDQLPELVDSLTKLELRENKEKQFNFDFIGKIPRLSSLNVEQPLLFEPFRSLIRCSAELVEGGFCLELNKKWFFIWKAKDCKHWKIGENNYYQIVCETEQPDEILQYFARLQGEEPMVF